MLNVVCAFIFIDIDMVIPKTDLRNMSKDLV